jgi:cobalamin biosynthesis Mg chelatase CobN
MTEDIETIRGKTLPDALKSIQESKETLDKIVSYYVDTKSTEYEKFFQQTQDHTKEAITNVAYHAHTVGTHLTNFLKLQLLELEKLELHLCTLADRMRLSHDSAGQLGYRTPASVKKYRVTGVKTAATTAFQPPKWPEYVRRPIAVDSLLDQFGPSSHIWISPDTQPLTPLPRGHTVTPTAASATPAASSSSTTTATVSTATATKHTKSVSKSRTKEKEHKRHNKTSSKKGSSSRTTTGVPSSSSSAGSIVSSSTNKMISTNTTEPPGTKSQRTTKDDESHTSSEEPPLPPPPPQLPDTGASSSNNTIQDFTYIGDDADRSDDDNDNDNIKKSDAS